MFNFTTPKALSDEAKKFIIGQDQSVDALSSFLFQYILFQYSQFGPTKLDNKLNALVMGPSGHGKTYMVKKLAELMGFDFIELNAKGFSQEGWEGTSFRDLLGNELMMRTSRQRVKPWCIVFIDEFDKMCSPLSSTSTEKYAEAIQSSLLKYIEPYTYLWSQRKGDHSVQIDTSKLCFIFSGNFQALRDNRISSGTMGFISVPCSDSNHLSKELEKYGVIPEIVGRLSHIIELNELEKSTFEAILSNENFYLNKLKEIFTRLQFTKAEFNTDKAILAALDSKLGIRGLIQELNIQVNEIVTSNSDKFDLICQYFEYRKLEDEEPLTVRRLR